MRISPPITRFEEIVVQELSSEILVCDTRNNRVFCLNETASEVWKLCDGKNSIKEISLQLSRKFDSNINEEFVLFTLNELDKENLLNNFKKENTFFSGVSRRDVIKKIGLASAVALPIISSVVMPKAVNAQSCFAENDSCGDDVECCSNCCNGRNCVDNNGGTRLPAGSPCTSGSECCSGCCSGDTISPGTCNPGC